MTHQPQSSPGHEAPIDTTAATTNNWWSPAIANLPAHKLERLRREEAFAEAHRKYFSKLTPSQIEVLQMICEGLSTKEIAQRRFVAEGTIRKHRNMLYEALEIHNVIQAMQYGLAFDLV
ncbi:MAG: LuxR C-terminal-related transcriptional regulator [Bacteroidota bacterium]